MRYHVPYGYVPHGKRPFPKGKQGGLTVAKGKGAGAKNPHFSAPYKGVRVVKATPKGDQLVCEFNARKMVGAKGSLELLTDKRAATFQCESVEHAQALAEHAKKLHARKTRHGLIYSLKKLSEGVTLEDGTDVSGEALLKKARERAAKKYKIRQDIKAEKDKRRRMEEERRVKSERQSSN
jgi:hypothetical protein